MICTKNKQQHEPKNNYELHTQMDEDDLEDTKREY